MSIRRKPYIIASVLSLLASGCTVIDQPHGDLPPVIAASDPVSTPTGQVTTLLNAEISDIGDLLHFYRLVSTAPIKALREEFERTKQEFASNKNARNQWRMATLLSLPGGPFYDSARSSTLFKELTNGDFEHNPLLNDAAFLMYSLLNDQHQTIKKAESLSNQLSDALSANKMLQDQLNALKAIEDTLYERNKAEVKPKP